MEARDTNVFPPAIFRQRALDCCGSNCRNTPITKIFTITDNFRTHGNLEMASQVGDEGDLDGEHEGQPALDQKQPTIGPVISRKRKNNDDSAKEIVEIMKANANFRKEKFEQKHVVPQFDETEMFCWSMGKIAKRLPSIDQARIRMELCCMVSEAEVKQMEMGTPSSVTHPNQPSSGSSHYSQNWFISSQEVSPLSTQESILSPQSSEKMYSM
jgi:hypothetical protein